MQLAYDQFVPVRWTSAIHEEWISILASDRPDIQITQLEMLRDKINNAVPDCLILNYESLISTLTKSGFVGYQRRLQRGLAKYDYSPLLHLGHVEQFDRDDLIAFGAARGMNFGRVTDTFTNQAACNRR